MTIPDYTNETHWFLRLGIMSQAEIDLEQERQTRKLLKEFDAENDLLYGMDIIEGGRDDRPTMMHEFV